VIDLGQLLASTNGSVSYCSIAVDLANKTPVLLSSKSDFGARGWIGMLADAVK
tara:strand:+ start:305 stop:463 length:159 start_codon:yes stop_codon:yes gene_type:complete